MMLVTQSGKWIGKPHHRGERCGLEALEDRVAAFKMDWCTRVGEEKVDNDQLESGLV